MQRQNYILYFGLAMLALLVLKVLYAPQEVTEVVLPPVTEEVSEVSEVPQIPEASVEGELEMPVEGEVGGEVEGEVEVEMEVEGEVVEGMSCGCGSPPKKLPSGYYFGGYSGSLNEQMIPKKYPASIPEGIDFKQEHPDLNTMDSFPAPVKGSVWSSTQVVPKGEFDLPEKYPLLSQ
ncbi:MAG: hypothetical protein CMF62_01545 [Magnetococcales bacterium]|nr:hypothetical protein [Magnetococcales bacterium]|tara:strand:- start:41288 stop:41818 length:531 start_codon:yes stop_codon:yes gene_type:complete